MCFQFLSRQKAGAQRLIMGGAPEGGPGVLGLPMRGRKPGVLGHALDEGHRYQFC